MAKQDLDPRQRGMSARVAGDILARVAAVGIVLGGPALMQTEPINTYMDRIARAALGRPSAEEEERQSAREMQVTAERMAAGFRSRGIPATVFGPETAYAAEVRRSDSATFIGFPSKVEGVQVSTNTEFNADGIGAFVDRTGAALPSLSPITRAEVPVDSTGALILPHNRMLTLDTHDGKMMPDGKDRTTAQFFRMSPGEALYITGGEFTSVKAHAATVGDLDMIFPQLDVRGDYPGVTNPQDHGIFILSANDAETPEGGPVISIEGAVPGHARVVKFKAGTVNPRIHETQVYGFWQLSAGNGVKDLTVVNLETGALGQWRADVGKSLGADVRRPLDKATMWRQDALVKNF